MIDSSFIVGYYIGFIVALLVLYIIMPNKKES